MLSSRVVSSLRPFSSSLRINNLRRSYKELELGKSNKLQRCLHDSNIRFGYFTLVDKPIQSVSLNSIIELGAEFMYFPFMNWSWPAQTSIFIGAIAYRILIQLATKFIQNLKYKNFQNRFVYKFMQKVFLVDLNRDISFYVCYVCDIWQGIDQRKSSKLFKYYTVGYLVKNLLTFYLSLNFMRAAHYILVNDSFNAFHLHTSIFPTLAAYDPTFLLPLIPMALTYLWVSGSRHPLLIHLTRPQNRFFRINIAFMTGLIFVPLPTIYALSYAGLVTGHLLIRKIYHQKSDIKEDVSNILQTKPQPLQKPQKAQQSSSEKQKNQKETDQDGKK